MKIVPRHAEAHFRRLLKSFPAVLILGPRQCGKSTFVRECLPDWALFDLERPADLALVQADQEGFFDAHPRRIVIDEAQRLPSLFATLRHALDRNRRNGRIVLTGSASPDLVRSVSESLAGRVALLELAPFSSAELAGTRRSTQRWFWGGYPLVHAARSNAARLDWLDAYVSTFLERDLPALGLRLPAARLRTLWTMLTHVHGNLLNASDLARSLGVSSPTITHYLDVLEGAYMIRRLPPFFANVQKRLTKSPKIYIRDSGLLHFLAGLREPRDLDGWSRRGASFEGLVIEELITRALKQWVRPQIHFWRTRAGGEVDLLLGDGRRLVPVEIKLSTTVERRDLVGLRQCMKDLDLKRGFVIANSAEPRDIGRHLRVIPWRHLANGGEVPGLP
jgi:predicted AAA+ superfamily ATPase